MKELKIKSLSIIFSRGIPWKDPRKKDGEIIWPQGISKESLELFKTKDFHNDSYRIAGQLQQRPSPAGGGILKEEWFKAWKQKDVPEFEYIIQSWDTALTGGNLSCYSACTTWGIFKDKGGIRNIMLLSLFKGRIEYPALRKMATRLYNNYEDKYIDDPLIGRNNPDLILIEAKVSGYSLLADLMSANLPVTKFDPGRHGDKIGRCRMISHLIENGLVWLQTESPNHEFYTEDSEILLEASINFPNAESNDIIDCMSQAFIWITSNGWVTNKEDPQIEQTPPWKKENKPYT